MDSELSVSDEIVDSGRGMYSTLSENPTRGRDGGLAATSANGGPNGSDSPSWISGAELDCSRTADSAGCSNGVFGKLLLRRGTSVGCMTLPTSWLEIAAERRCA